MTKIEIKRAQDGLITSLIIRGHSGYAESGSDIVCSSVSTAINLTVNLIEKFGLKYKFRIDEIIPLTEFILLESNKEAQIILNTFVEFITSLASDYHKYLKIIS